MRPHITSRGIFTGCNVKRRADTFASMTTPRSPVPLILDTDIGDDVDDVFALLLAVRDPAYDLRAVTVVYGQVEARARLARYVLDLAGRPDIPVAIGSSASLAGPVNPGDGGNSMASADEVMPGQGSSEWDNLGSRLDPRPASELIIELVRNATVPPVLAAIGPLTNIAQVLRQAPDIAGRVASLVIMGGRLGQGSDVGEHNLNMDPEAAAIVLGSTAPIRVGTFDVTRNAVLGHDDVERLRAGDPACQSAGDQLALYLRRRNRPVTSMYDPVAMTLAINEDYLRTQALDVALDVDVPGRKVITRVHAGLPGAVTMQASIAIDVPAFHAHLMNTITGTPTPH